MSTSSSADDLSPVGGSPARYLRPGLFEGRQVLVTGGTSGIGAAISAAFLELGADVLATGVSDAEIEAARAREDLRRVELAVLDVRDRKAVDALVAGLPRLDHVVNCAGVIRRNDELEPDVFADVVDINLNGSMRVCAAARPRLAETRGTIVNTASMLSFFGGGLVPGYSASKGGVAQLTKSLAIAYAADGIRVNAIAPGWIATPLTSAIRANADRNQAIVGRTPLGRWGDPSELAGGVLYLSSPLATYVTGSVLVIDGGYLIT